MECICINDSYDNPTLTFWEVHGVKHPLQDKLYTIGSKKLHTIGKVGVTVYEIHNPKVPIEHPILGPIMMDVTFNIDRFRTLSMKKITKEELENIEVI